MATPQMGGIYEIVNLVNGKRYIGSAVRLDLRWRQHRALLNRGKHHSRHLQSAWAQHGADAFQFVVVENCDAESLILREQSAIDRLCPEYNICPVAGSSLGRKFTDETKAKIAAKAVGRKRDPASIEQGAAKLRGRQRPPEQAAKLIGNKHALGHVHTDEWKAATSERQRGMKRPKSPEYREKIAATLRGRKATDEHRANQSAAQRGKKRGPYKLDPAKAEARREAGRKLQAVLAARRAADASASQ